MSLQFLLSSSFEKLATLGPRRLLHGRGGMFPDYPHLVIDWYPPVMLFICYHPQTEVQLQAELESFRQCPAIKAAVLQRRYEGRNDKSILWGEITGPFWVEENGLSFQVNLQDNLNHGLFLDTALARQRVEQISQHRTVLNLFCYSCAFSLYALRGGAKHVYNMDMSKGALRLGRENHRQNDMLDSRVSFFSHDILKSFGKLDRLAPFDLIIIDPPTFQHGSFDYKKDYAKLLRRLVPNLSDRGELLLCLNCPDEDLSFFENLLSPLSLHIKESLPLAEGFEEYNVSRGLKVIRV